MTSSARVPASRADEKLGPFGLENKDSKLAGRRRSSLL
jgi:hypothetical protein